MNNDHGNVPIWKRGSWVMAQQQSNPNLDQVGGISVATRGKVDCSSGKYHF